MQFSTDLLKTFIAVCEQRSFTLAAERLHRSQPSVSTHIALLENQSGLKFFDRSERPLKLTEAGGILLQLAREVVNKAVEVDRSLAELASGIAGQVRIGASTSVGTYLLSGIIGAVKKEYPKLRLFVLTQPRGKIYDSVRDAEVDFAFVLTDAPPVGLISKALRDEPLLFVASSRHPFARKKAITPKQLQSAGFIVGLQHTEYSRMVDAILVRNSIPNPRVEMRISNFDGIKEAVRSGAGVCILPRFAVERDIREKSLVNLAFAGIHLSATIMLIEREQPLLTPSVASVKKLLAGRI
jgi:DNA-binding transcriptional LysR family regulator